MKNQQGPVRFSVIMPVYNREDLLRTSLASVLDQQRRPDEIIIRDDGSTDNSVTVAEAMLRPAGIPFHLIKGRNEGPSKARCEAIDASSGNWLVFLDSDDLWRADYLAKLEALIADAEPECVVTNFIKQDALGRQISEPKFSEVPMGYWEDGFDSIENHEALVSVGGVDLFLKTLMFQPCFTSSLACSRQAYERVGGIQPMPKATKSEDSQLVRKLYFYCRTAFLQSELVRIVLHAGNRSLADGEIDLIGKFEGRVAILRLLHQREDIRQACGRQLEREINRSDRDIFNQLYWSQDYREALVQYRRTDKRFYGVREYGRLLFSLIRASRSVAVDRK